MNDPGFGMQYATAQMMLRRKYRNCSPSSQRAGSIFSSYVKLMPSGSCTRQVCFPSGPAISKESSICRTYRRPGCSDLMDLRCCRISSSGGFAKELTYTFRAMNSSCFLQFIGQRLWTIHNVSMRTWTGLYTTILLARSQSRA